MSVSMKQVIDGIKKAGLPFVTAEARKHLWLNDSITIKKDKKAPFTFIAHVEYSSDLATKAAGVKTVFEGLGLETRVLPQRGWILVEGIDTAAVAAAATAVAK